MPSEWDRAIHGNVPVEHSRQMNRLLKEKGFDVQYHEEPDQGHGFVYSEKIQRMFIPWMLKQKKVRNPMHVALATYWLRHNKSYWVRIDQLREYGKRGLVDATLSEDGKALTVKTENVAALSLGPIEGASSVEIVIDGKNTGSSDLSQRQSFKIAKPRFNIFSSGAWKPRDGNLGSQKRPGVSGPFSDLFFDNTIRVIGTQGGGEDDFHLSNVGGYFHGRFFIYNGGLHRGGIEGSNSVKIPGGDDVDITDKQIASNNLILFGTHETNSVLKRFEGRLPISFGDGELTLAGKTFKGEKIAAFATFPHPDNPERYIAVHGGVTPDAVVWGCYLNALLLPDYIVYDGGKTLAWGFFDNDWKLAE